ncbi:sushi, von Willebrand factor type A, EGF and pentraxin domain-containing protein 1-like isoform X3 [Haliotis cracherodii]|uniref:sushi, von Willebrand factor type A, EGF and pentraxin domain-containing protein 1-like isoform X3 n=1 Tax=Haliotis cracherodii TaxID=6455 RepID=UPI0039E8C588
MTVISTTLVLFWICAVAVVYSHKVTERRYSRYGGYWHNKVIARQHYYQGTQRDPPPSWSTRRYGNGQQMGDSIDAKPDMTAEQKKIFVVDILPADIDNDNIPPLLLERAPAMERAFDEEGGIYEYLERSGLLNTISNFLNMGLDRLKNFFKKEVVKPNMPPVISCPRSLEVFSEPGRSTALVTWTEPSVSDREDPRERLNLQQVMGERNGARMSGHVNVKYTVTDSKGRSDFCTFTVTIKRVLCQAWPIYHGSNNCSTNNVYYGDTCELSCETGYELTGLSTITCKKNGRFSTESTQCKAIQCPVLQLPENGEEWYCGDENNFKSVCSLTCKEGFRLDADERAPWQVAGTKCQANKTWTEKPICKDVRAPRITNCPPGFIRQYAERGRNSAVVSWPELVAEDNSDSDVAIILRKGNISGSRFEVGSHEITYEAVDDSGLTDDCSFMVNVVTRSCRAPVFRHPRLDVNCGDQFTHGSSCSVSCTHGITLLGASNITCELINGTMEWDTPGGRPSCDEKECIIPEDPPNSNMNCGEFSGGQICRVQCKRGKIPARNANMVASLICTPAQGVWSNNDNPGCVKQRDSSVLETSLGYYWSSKCTEEDTQNVTDTFEKITRLESFYSNCPVCHIQNIRSACKENRRGQLFMVVKMDVRRRLLETDGTEVADMVMRTVGLKIYRWLKVNLKTLNIIGRRSRIIYKKYPVTAMCDAQYAADKASRGCAACGVGYEYDGQTGCRMCRTGTYQDDTGNLKCRECPEGTFTLALRRSREDCKAPCPKGSYSSTGLEPCTKCPVGQYQELERSTTCKSCAEKEITPSVGSEQQSDCYQQSTKVFRLKKVDIGSTFVTLKWAQPTHPRATLIGYGSAFHKASDSEDTREYLNVTSSNITRVTITDLEPVTEYTVYVWAVTVTGPGVKRSVNVTTENVTVTTTQIPPETTVDPALCPPGTNSRNGRKERDGTCVPCGYGFYQEHVGRRTCKVCKAGFTTWIMGATSRKDCVDKRWTTPTPSTTTAPPEPCDDGYVSVTGFKPECTMCPDGKRNNDARTECYWCDDPFCSVATTTQPPATTIQPPSNAATTDSVVTTVSDGSNRTDKRSTGVTFPQRGTA